MAGSVASDASFVGEAKSTRRKLWTKEKAGITAMESESPAMQASRCNRHHLERLLSMLADEKNLTWDLSPNDKEAIAAAVNECEFSAIRQRRLEECYKLMDEQNQHIQNLERIIAGIR